ncbi:pentapeptide repeat-containing protein [Streptomyces sp. CA-252508]|uniref:pentapeptide repeat-containing protein n=1 Tax=Streptomyces sp. CA-252508 TaxID=3418946 RepID=UPI003D8B2E42
MAKRRPDRDSGTIVDLSNVDLRGLALSDKVVMRFPGAIFRKADLRHADFTNADLRRAEFSEANLESARLERSNLKDAGLTTSCTVGVETSSLDG